MTALRQRMIEDMQLRNFSPHTQRAYINAVVMFSKHTGRSPEHLTVDEVRTYLLHLVQKERASWPRYNVARCALQFLYRVTLGRDEKYGSLPCARVPQRLPTVLSAEELKRLFDATRNLRHRTMLMTTYGAGLRVSELVSLRIGDIDSARMLVHVRQGKGQRERIVKLSAHLLETLRTYWKKYRPKDLLFPSLKKPGEPLSTTGLVDLVKAVATRAGIRKRVSPHTLRHS
ncbi:MAG: site-specific integrase [Deltaproteobacteria bacterium]|nr:site-specific integrase [Deltaproteobacteria bacterium]